MTDKRDVKKPLDQKSTLLCFVGLKTTAFGRSFILRKSVNNICLIVAGEAAKLSLVEFQFLLSSRAIWFLCD